MKIVDVKPRPGGTYAAEPPFSGDLGEQAPVSATGSDDLPLSPIPGSALDSVSVRERTATSRHTGEPGSAPQVPEERQEPSDVPADPARSGEGEAIKRRYRHHSIDWADISRGISLLAIIAIVVESFFATSPLTHVPPSLDASLIEDVSLVAREPLTVLSSFLGSFAYPLAFLCIGYTMKLQRISLSYIRDLAGKYLLPYMIFGIIAALIYAASPNDGGVAEYLAALAYGNGDLRGHLVLSAPFAQVSIPVLWLLPTIMFGQIIAFVIARLPLIPRLFAAMFLFFAGSASAGHVFLPFDIQPAMCAAWFMTCGMVLRSQHAFASWGIERVLFTICLTLGVAYTALVTVGFLSVPDPVAASYRNGVIDMFGAACAAGAAMMLARLISLWEPANRLMCRCGESFLASVSFLGPVCALVALAFPYIALASDAIGDVPMYILLTSCVAATVLGASYLISKVPYANEIFDRYTVQHGFDPASRSEKKRRKAERKRAKDGARDENNIDQEGA